MLQRQLLFKQLKELQQNQQLQELGEPRKQEYVNQLNSLKQGSGVQFPPSVNGEPLRDSQMQALGNMQMMQHGGSNVYQGFSNGFSGSPGQNRGTSLLTPQFDLSGYGSPSSSADKNLNFYSQLQGMSGQSDNMWAKRASGIHPSGSASSFPSQQANFTSDQMRNSDGALLPNQMFQENNFFGQVSGQSLSNEILSANYASQRIRMQRHEENTWHGVSPLKAPDVAMPEDDASLDALERKILYETDDDSMGLLLGDSDGGKGGFQGKMSALMQSAVAETLSSDNGTQDDWSGFHNHDQPPDNMSLTSINNGMLQNTWVDRNLHDAPYRVSQLQKAGNYGFPGLQLPGHQYPKHEDEIQPNPHGLGQQSQPKRATGGMQLIQSLPSSNALPSQFDEGRRGLWHQGTTSISTTSGVQDTFDQVNQNQMNVNRFSVESQRMVSGGNDEPMPTNFLASTVSHRQTMNNDQRRVGEPPFNKDLMQLNSRISYLSMGNSSGSSIQDPYVNDYIKNPSPPNHMAAQFLGLNNASSQAIFKPSDVSTESQHVVTPVGRPTSRPHTPQHDSSSPKSLKFPYNLFRPSDSSLSRPETHSTVPNEHLNSIEMHNLIPLASSVSQQPFHQADKKDAEVSAFPGGISSLSQTSEHNNSAYKVLSPRDTGMDSGKKSASSHDGVTYHQALGMNERNEGSSLAEAQEDQSFRASALAEIRNSQPSETFGQADSRTHSTSTNETSAGARPSQISLQMAPPWFKHHGTLDSNETSRIFYPKGTVDVAEPFPQFSAGNLQENGIEGKPAMPSQESGLWPASSSVMISGGLLPPQNLSVDAANLNLDISLSKKRKVALEPVPWHKEIQNEASDLQDVSMAEEWAHATNCRLEEVKLKHESVTIDELPVNQAKRRLVSTTLLMHQLFQPPPSVILSADANSNCDSVAYFTSRLVLGELCILISKPPSNPEDAPKNPRRSSECNFSKITEFVARKAVDLEGVLSRLDKKISMADVKLESQELERFSIINRFAKFHVRPHPGTYEQSSSSGASSCLKPQLQRYIIANPMPTSIPEAVDCLSL